MISSAFSQAIGGPNQSLIAYGVYSAVVALSTYKSIGKSFTKVLIISCMVTLGFALSYNEGSTRASEHLGSF